MKNISCPLCKSSNYSKNEYCPGNSEFLIVDCANCATIYTLIFENIDIEETYNTDKYTVVDNRGSIFDRLIGYESMEVLKDLERFVERDNRTILDFGSGKGKFLSIAKKRNWITKGIEISKPRANFAKEKYGLDIDNSYYSSGKIGERSYHVISMLHVLEHLADVEVVQNLISSNLSKDGYFVVEVPNIDSWQAMIAKSHWMHLDLPKHVLHFSKKTLTNLLHKLELDVVKVRYWSIHLGVLGMVHALLGCLGYEGDIIYDLKFRQSLKIRLLIFIILPLAFLLEFLGAATRKGGILRIIAKKRHKE